MSPAKFCDVSWYDVQPAPLVLLQGPEDLLADRAEQVIIGHAKAATPDLEVTRLEASTYAKGTLDVVVSPSLFGEPKLVVIEALEAGNDAAMLELLDYVPRPEPDVTVILRHGGGVRGKKLLTALGAAGIQRVACDALKKDQERVSFVTGEFKRLGRRAQPAAIRALVDALGSDLRELASACSQLATDTSDTKAPIDADLVNLYYGGRIETTAFKVADAAVTGNIGEALKLLRQAHATGADPVPLVAALANKVRQLAKVSALRGGDITARDLGLQPWMLDRARKDLQHWRPAGLAQAIEAVAQADADVKGASRHPMFAVERAIIKIADARGVR
ncbi:DNA polymerase III subunit delta [Micrococcales bacterium 31B]|nr:DNA polymerase III subunit delta [Micrococcales bacterium 31B]